MKAPALLEFPDEPVLAAFAAIMLGSSPTDPPPDATAIARMAARLTEPRPARRPGDVEATRSFRSVYALARDQAGVPGRPPATVGTKASLVLDATLALRHRQRAALALRYVFGLPPAAVARVIGSSRARTADVIRAATLNVSRSAGGRVDVARHLRRLGAAIRSRPLEVAADAAVGEPRSVMRLLLSPLEERGASADPTLHWPPRPVYRLRERMPETIPAPSLPRAPDLSQRRPRRVGLLVAACVAALTFLGAFAPTALLRQSGSRVPLAAVPIAPAVQEAGGVEERPVLVVDYRVREGDALWLIARRTLGDGSRWPEIWRANAGRPMADGSRFLDPDEIRPGWRLRLPRR